MTVGRFIRTPKGQLLVVLLVLAIPAMLVAGPPMAAATLATAALSAALLDAGVLRMRKGRWTFPSGALLTGLLIGMILSVREPWYVAAGTSALAIASKYVARGRTANIFNPAALALVAAFYLFDASQSWWGTLPDAHPAAILAVIALGGYITVQNNKTAAVLTFLGVHFLLFTLVALGQDAMVAAQIFRSPDLHAAMFFALFMVTDPPTSPPKHRDQLIYGVIVAIGSFAAFSLTGAVYYLLAGLLVANVWEGWRRAKATKKGGERAGHLDAADGPVASRPRERPREARPA